MARPTSPQPELVLISVIVDFLRHVAQSVLDRWFDAARGRDRLRVITWWMHQVNADGCGTYLCMWVKIINRGERTVWIERLECDDARGETYYPKVVNFTLNREVLPRRNVVVFIPCGHITKPPAAALRVVDSTESVHRASRRAFRAAVQDLHDEQLRLQELGFAVHPNASTMATP